MGLFEPLRPKSRINPTDEALNPKTLCPKHSCSSLSGFEAMIFAYLSESGYGSTDSHIMVLVGF